jgi:hypothetical protein
VSPKDGEYENNGIPDTFNRFIVNILQTIIDDTRDTSPSLWMGGP